MPRSRPLYALLLAAALTASSASFLGASLLSQEHMSRIDRAAQEIAGNAGPSIERLAELRGHLRHLFRALDDDGAPNARAAIAEATTALARYRALPSFTGEEALARRLDRSLSGLAQAVDAAIAPGAPRAAHDRAIAAIDAADDEAVRLLDFNAEQSRTTARRIAETRRGGAELTALLDGVAVLTTALAAALALFLARRSRRSEEEQRALLARRADELERFSARVAHDVLSPLTAVSLGLEQWQRRAADDPSRGACRRAQAALARTRRIVDGLFEFASAGARPAPDARCAVREVLDDVLRALAPSAETARATLAVAPPEGPLQAACSPGVLTSILSNLIGNALKYLGASEERRVEVRAARSGDALRVEVEDTGPGLPPGAERLIFEPYVRATASLPGLGLGLATVKGMVEGHGGRVDVRSTPGRGCVFWFELPLARPA